MRYSHQREKILEAVKSVKTHPTADMVYDGLHADNPNLSLGTVYRNLALLALNGDITPIYTGDNKVHYDGDTNPHCHFVCKSCSKIIDVFIQPQIPTEVLNETEFQVEEKKTIFYGRCKYCLA
jgi:Fur family peroxide stress response transcriptional regulator